MSKIDNFFLDIFRIKNQKSRIVILLGLCLPLCLTLPVQAQKGEKNRGLVSRTLFQGVYQFKEGRLNDNGTNTVYNETGDYTDIPYSESSSYNCSAPGLGANLLSVDEKSGFAFSMNSLISSCNDVLHPYLDFGFLFNILSVPNFSLVLGPELFGLGALRIGSKPIFTIDTGNDYTRDYNVQINAGGGLKMLAGVEVIPRLRFEGYVTPSFVVSILDSSAPFIGSGFGYGILGSFEFYRKGKASASVHAGFQSLSLPSSKNIDTYYGEDLLTLSNNTLLLGVSGSF